MAAPAHSFEHHAKLVPGFHYALAPLLLLNFLWQAWRAVTAFSADAVVSLLVAIALVMVALFARGFAVGVQDRVIRLEERLRLAELAPDLKPRLHTLTIDQVVALRFASDAEAPALTRKVLDEGLTDRKAIKRLVQAWRPDHARI
jgi:hypothetical protein